MSTKERIISLIESNFPNYAVFERKMGIAPQTVNDWKRNKSKSYLKIIPQLAKALNTTSSYLLCETNNPAPPDAEKSTQNEIILDELEFALFGEVRGLRDEEKKELIRMASRMRELEELKRQKKS